MAPSSHGRAGPPTRESYGNGGPPPSTLAAQLVENISASARTSRPDETAELKKFFAIIENVKNQPDLLKSQEERVEHNHMLIYVYSRVVLEGLRWDDPFSDRAQLRADALRALSFMKVTTRETPEVLLVSHAATAFIFRGQEPLWLWILPKILKLLGHSQCLALTTAIEDFIRDIYVEICHTGQLWPMMQSFLGYFQNAFEAILKHLQGLKALSRDKDISLSLRLPLDSFLESTFGEDVAAIRQHCTYTLATASHALRHSMSILSLVSQFFQCHGLNDSVASVATDYLPWLIDSLYTLYEIQAYGPASVLDLLPSLLRTSSKLSAILQGMVDVDPLLKQKSYSTLVLLCGEAACHYNQFVADQGDIAKQELCATMIQIAGLCISHKPTSKLAASQLLPIFDKLSIHGSEMLPNTDFWVLLRHNVSDFASGSDETTVFPEAFDNRDLARQVTALTLPIALPAAVEPPPKRRKVTAESQALPQVFNLLSQLLGSEMQVESSGLGDQIKNKFAQLNNLDRCSVIDLLGYLCCAADNTLAVDANDKTASSFQCSYCDNTHATNQQPASTDHVTKSYVLRTFSDLVSMQAFNESRQPRITAMVALRRLAKHSNDPKFLDLAVTPAAQWCLKSLQSSVRELRIASSRTLPVFLNDSTLRNPSSDVIHRNRNLALSVLRSISEQNQPERVETCIMTWSQLGRVVPDDQLNLVLVKLVDYLGHATTIASATAFDDIFNLARARHTSPRQMFEPFWRYIAFSAVKDLPSQPKPTRLLAELLGLSIAEFLLLTQRHTLPWLVLTKKQEVIQKIAEVRGEKDSWRPCLDNDNLGPILALLLVQDVSDVESHSMSLLRHISPHFDGFTLGEIISIEPLMTCLELLKAIGDAEERLKPHIRKSLEIMISMYQAANGEAKQRRSHATGHFLQDQVLGLVARLTDIFNDPSNIRSTVEEQKRCIKAMEEMIRVGKGYVRIARPQISACILSSITRDELCSPAFSCWAAMIFYLDEEDVEVLVETTFFIIGHYWSSFDEDTRHLSREVIEFLLKEQRSILEALISKLPSFSHISSLTEVEAKLNELRKPVDNRTAFNLLAERILHDNSGVVLQALRELTSYLQRQQGYLQASAVSEQLDPVVPTLARALLDCSAKYAAEHNEISRLCTQGIGLLGCLDPNRVETVRDERQVVLESNLQSSEETTDFVLVIIEDVLVKSFLSATDTKFQGLLSWAMQELLDRCDIGAAIKMVGQKGSMQNGIDRIYRRFLAISEGAREIITPFLSSRYKLVPMPHQQIEYPIFRPGRTYGFWMRSLTLDLLRKPQTPFADLIFEPLCRVIRLKDLSIAEFLFPYLILHVIIGEQSTEEVKTNVLNELSNVLQHELPKEASFAEREDKKLFYEVVFRVLDYAMRWHHAKRSKSNQTTNDIEAMQRVQTILDSIPAELISQRAVDCKAYSRALFHLEQHIRQVEEAKSSDDQRDRLLQRLQDIYTQIDEPDGLEGISAHLHILDINQQILSHRKAGRWTAAQTWYEIKLAEDPDNVDVQIELLTCLKESGQHDVLLNYVEGIEKHTAVTTINRVVPYAVEASWATGRWQTMQKFISRYQGDHTENFNVCIAQALLHLQKGWTKAFVEEIKMIRDRISSSMTFTTTSSLHACHEAMLKCHVLTDLELIAGTSNDGSQHPQEILKSLDRRLEVLGSYVNDKQYVLGIRRAAMELSRSRFTDLDISSLWLASARLARKANSMHQSFNAVLHASQLGDDSATIENARLLWKEGHNRKAIQTLQSAVSSNAFLSRSFNTEGDMSEKTAESQQNLLTARAQLLLAKWLDNAGQTHASALRQQYQNVPKNYGQWEKGHYYLGRHYKKVLESEKNLKPDDQSDEYLTGETAKLVIENYIRSLNYGTKYLYQTLPRILTLWLELGAQVDRAPEGKVSLSRELHHRRRTQLQSLHAYLHKYMQRLPAYIFYTALPQIVARIAHPNADVFTLLELIILKVVEAHPRQALWSLFAIITSKQATSERRVRGQQILQKLRGMGKKVEGGSYDLKSLLRMGEKLAEQLLLACNNGDFQSNRTTHASITRDLNFNHKCTPCPLVVPIESCLTATLPTLTDNVKKHKAFSRDVITIDSFLDEVLVLGSLAKPRRLKARGSNGQTYCLLIKPKDDLRTDQRLMEFNSMINRSLKRDAESSMRQLYIKTYAVTPLNEECGIIEWVDGLKTLRDILLQLYRSRGIVPNYNQLAQMMKDAASNEKNTKMFTEGVLGMFPPVLPHWFISQFPNPSTWFAARLKYTRSCAVMSMVGTILGLGDRHGENVLLEEGNGGVFHVDFNCLFDKGLTFAQPERVPFRLTHNMVAAMGIHGYEGPFRKCSELTLSILRQQEETLMTILEAFIYDPTLDLQKDKKRKHEVVKLNPHSVVESIKRKVRGLLPDESIPLGVEGQVEELIKQAVSPRNLTAMYIGWCPFL
ncbi:phosphatidylinositol 3 [Xylariales sp. PMI_506]|nr:phosphatidylinositol 3 [Xylariales sp. PMI_506]